MSMSVKPTQPETKMNRIYGASLILSQLLELLEWFLPFG